MEVPTPATDLTRPASDFVTAVDTVIRSDQTVGEALGKLRERKPRHDVLYFYVLDREDRLAGVMPTRRLLLATPGEAVEAVMHRPVVRVRGDTTLGEAMEEFATHRLLALPVVDGEDRLLGLIDVRLYAEEALDLGETRGASDLFQMIGLSVEQARQGTAMAGFRMRMPWLMCNMASGVACAVIAAVFEATLDQIVLLAMFIPLVLTLSESVSMQAMTISLQFLHRAAVPWRAIRQRTVVEGKTVVLLGVCSGLLVAVASVFWGGFAVPPGGQVPPALVLGLSIAVSMGASALVGIAMPVFLHAWRLDPKVASGPVVLMIADVLTTSVYLGLGTWWLI